MIHNVILTGDFLATRESEQASNLRWIGDLLRAPIEAVGLTCQLGFEFDRAGLLAALGKGAERDARHCWIDPDGFDERALEQLRQVIGPGSLIVGYEMLSGTRAVLDKAGVPWIDMWLHPVRFCDDIFMSFASGMGNVQARIAAFGVDPEAMRAEARLLKIQNYRGFNRPSAALAENSCLLIGQTAMDKSVMGPRGFAELGQFENEINRLSAAHEICYFAPHPKAQRIEPAIKAMLSEGRLRAVSSPTYLLLSDPGVAHVAGLSSSVIEEARYFGKKTTFFIDPPVDWSAAVPVFQDFAFPHFWAEILQDVAEVTLAPRAGYLSPKNKMRDTLSFDWGYPHINRDRFEAVEAEPDVEAFGFAAELARAEVVSFDVFDTLIRRKVADPRDVFARINLDDPGFYQKRIDAAVAAGRAAQDRDEVTLGEIYAHLDGFDPAVEFAFELEVAAPREAGRELYEAARAAGKRIVLVSDMYFSAARVAELLRACGYDGWQAIYMSCETGAAKRTGRLWSHVLEQEQVAADRLFHIGDNPVGDIAKPAELGIRTYHLPMAKVQFAESGDWARDVAKALGRDGSELFAHVQNDLVGPGRVAWDPEAFGAAVLGPLLVGFAQWLEAQEHDRLHFLTREGEVMAAVFAEVSDGAFGELFASRALVAPLGVFDEGDIERVIGGGLAEQSLAGFFERQFGVDIAAWDLDGTGFPSAEVLIGVKTDRAALEALALTHSAEVLAACEVLRARVRGYLAAQGVGDGSALVDIGYNGTVQRAYGGVLGVQLAGLYMGLFDTADDLARAKGWLAKGVRKADHAHAICKHRAIWEVLLCAPEGSVIGLTDGHEAVRSNARDLRRQEFVREAHAGAVRFAKEWVAAGNLAISAQQGEAMLKAVLDQPDAGLAQLLADLEFEDPFERRGLRPLIGKDAASSLWKEGFAALNQSAFHQSRSGARRPKWEPWGAYGVLGWRHVLPVFVGPVIGWIGEPHDVDHYKEDPIGFFRGLSDPKFRKIGRVLYPWAD